MRILGIDYGTKRVGLALTDNKGLMAFPYSVLENNDNLITELEKIIAKEAVDTIVIGHSLNTKGEENVLHQAVEALMLDLTLTVGLPIELEPEQYTTQEALRFQGRTPLTDAAAATIILNSYLERQRYKK